MFKFDLKVWKMFDWKFKILDWKFKMFDWKFKMFDWKFKILNRKLFRNVARGTDLDRTSRNNIWWFERFKMQIMLKNKKYLSEFIRNDRSTPTRCYQID